MLVRSGASNTSGNSVTTLIVSIGPRPPPRPHPRRRSDSATARPPRVKSPRRTTGAIPDDTRGAAPRSAVPPPLPGPRSPRAPGPWARRPRPGSPRADTPPPLLAARAASAAARLGGPFAENSRPLEQRAHCVGRERALVQPGPRLLRVHLDVRGIRARVVVAEHRDEPSVARRARVGDHNPEIALTLAPLTPQPNTSCHNAPRFFSEASSCAGTAPAVG